MANSKIYKVTDSNFCDLTIEAIETDLAIADIAENELFPIEEFKEFRIRLVNEGGMGEIIDFAEWRRAWK